MAASLSVALIGFGFVGSTFHAPYLTTTAGLELKLVSSRDPDKVKEALAPFDAKPQIVGSPLEAATSDGIDLVVIASPNDSHFALAKAALEAGKHVVVDKPFTLDSTEARTLATIAKQHNRLLSVFQNRRWDSDFLAVRRALEDNLIGPLVEFESRIDRFRPQVRDRWREQALPGSGLWFDLGPHLADQALLLFGPPTEVSATITTSRPAAQVNDWAQVILHYPATAHQLALTVTLHASMLSAAPTPRFMAHGVAGSLLKQHADGQESQLRAGVSPLDEHFGVDNDPLLHYQQEGDPIAIAPPCGTQARYYAEIRDAIAGKVENPVTPAQATALMVLLETAQQAAASGQRLPLALNDDERKAWSQTVR
ncbi:putative oxidoreductase YdgJ [Carnimonas sp. R-84981]|uniref:oxidoreductase n=1 Tax=Carnimonas bestiolae TaxID=3402172 RepID=UPI003EDBB286